MFKYLFAIAFGIAGTASAVTTSAWTHTSEADFDGEKDHVVAVSFGELRLSRATHTLIDQDPRFDVVYAVRQMADGSTVLATGPNGSIMRLADGKLTELYKPAQTSLATALAADRKGQLLVGISGEKAILLSMDPATGATKELFSSSEVRFIWAIAPLADGSILLGTGPAGQLLQVQPDGKSRVVVTLRQHNILSILPQTQDMVIVGTDPDGLVVRVNVVTGEWFVLYNAPEPEITALTVDGAGNIYAAASAAVEAIAGEAGQPGRGRPEVSPDVPLHREPPAAPQPPALPDPTPGEPEPIPKAGVPVQHMTIGELAPTTAHAPPTSQPAMPPTAPEGGPAAPSSSAVYRIAPSGFVTEVFRRPLTIHSMFFADGVLLIGTGPDGKVFEFRPGAEEVTVVAESDSREVSAMTLDKDGRALLGTSNPGGLLRMDAGYATKGTYTSKPLDAGQPAQYGNIQLQGTLAASTAMTIATRSGNVTDPANGGWSKWSDDLPAAEFTKIPSPPARFLQYRLTLSTKDSTATPVIEEIKLFYTLPNVAPKIASIQIEPDLGEAGPNAILSPAVHHVSWAADDANHDRLVYSLHYRMGHRGQWILLKDKLEDNHFAWNTRQLADGRYQVRVTASDAPSNPVGEGLTAARFSDPVVVDNTPPVIGDVKTQVEGDKATVSLRAVDRTSIVAGVEYALDSGDDWQAVLPSGILYDSPDETVKFSVSKLAPGPHQLTIRARDSQGNTAYETLVLTVEAKK